MKPLLAFVNVLAVVAIVKNLQPDVYLFLTVVGLAIGVVYLLVEFLGET